MGITIPNSWTCSRIINVMHVKYLAYWYVVTAMTKHLVLDYKKCNI